jgi:hypothetical protein
MFAARQDQLKDLEAAYRGFRTALLALPTGKFLASLGDWAPRDIAAHFVGWNRITLAGCAALREGAVPFYFHDGTNDYRKINGGFLQRFSSPERDVLLQQIDQAMRELVAYLGRVDEAEWEQDTGVVHYRGGPATVARCVDSLIRDYRKHTEEIQAARA